MNSNSQSWNHYKKIRQQGKCTCTRLHKATFRNYTYVLNSGDPWTVSFIQTTLPSPPSPPTHFPASIISPTLSSHPIVIQCNPALKDHDMGVMQDIKYIFLHEAKKKHLLIIVMMKTVFVSRDERCADMIYKKKDNFIFWRNL